ncbi:MAG: tRNA 2-selenouridine(34) synthase MnmH [Gammaproteobacteria bacterium]|nr:tRNA 2-selenouridine(34) synthase MnmH [Gammaproteobacteria bacterium]
MTELPQTADYKSLFLNDIKMMDLRAPAEFSQGAFPQSDNRPLMDDEERQSVGLRYKEQGQDSAIELGHQLVSGETKAARLSDWSDFIQQHPQGVLYCFRGGLRSKITQQWIFENTGIIYPRVEGGYKALRRYLLDELDNNTNKIRPLILGGRTGSGKTILLNRLQQKIDLEGLFNHRGSVFGKHVTPQPGQIDIENNLSIALLKLANNGTQYILFEDEAPNIGSRNIPKALYAKMKQSPLLLLEESVETRTEIIFDEYIVNSLTEYRAANNRETGFRLWSEELLASLSRVQRRLGGERFKIIDQMMRDAIQTQIIADDHSQHKEWITKLLTDYYDPMYDYQLTKKNERVVFQGSSDEITEYLQREYQLI